MLFRVPPDVVELDVLDEVPLVGVDDEELEPLEVDPPFVDDVLPVVPVEDVEPLEEEVEETEWLAALLPDETVFALWKCEIKSITTTTIIIIDNIGIIILRGDTSYCWLSIILSSKN